MGLPKIDHLICTTILPSSKKKIRFRPYLFKEEKILSTAKQSGNVNDMAQAIKQVITNSVLDEIDVDALSTFDVEHLMVRLREASVGEAIPLQLPVKKCSNEKCPCELSGTVDLREVNLDKPVPERPKIPINDSGAFFTLRYPRFGDSTYLATIEDLQLRATTNVALCIDQIVEGDSVTYAADFELQELIAWVDTFTTKQLEPINKFLREIPGMNKKIEFVCKMKNCEQKDSVTLRGFESFFS